MKTPTTKFLLLTTCALTLLRCSGVGQLDSGGGPARSSDGKFAPGGPGSAPFDFQKECGINPKDLDDPNFMVFKQQMTSMPIITEGSQMGTNFRVIAQANVIVEQKGGGVSTQSTGVQILNTEAAAGSAIIGLFAPSIVKSKAQKQASAQSGVKTSKSMPNSDWIKLTSGSNQEYKDLLCAITASSSHTYAMQNGDSNTVTFSPALVNTVSPFVTRERAQKEIGSGRVLTVTANVSGKADNSVPGSYTGQVFIKMINPVFQVQDRTVTGDFAVEFVNRFPEGAYKAGLPARIVYVVNSSLKKFVMVGIQSDFRDPTTGTTREVYMIGQ